MLTTSCLTSCSLQCTFNLYLHRRVRGDAYYELLDELLTAVRQRYGNTTFLHFEDMAYENASKLLNMCVCVCVLCVACLYVCVTCLYVCIVCCVPICVCCVLRAYMCVMHAYMCVLCVACLYVCVVCCMLIRACTPA